MTEDLGNYVTAALGNNVTVHSRFCPFGLAGGSFELRDSPYGAPGRLRGTEPSTGRAGFGAGDGDGGTGRAALCRTALTSTPPIPR
ncbi:hypothetical protein ACIGW7_36400 [Streptomyces sp. NPDC053253]|uniref:hypothetical protein n=1 Tax=Streptomyces sp. NPDC053253 TaxID=3365699 RepID=UPI0037D00412